MIKVIHLIKRKPHLTHEQFREHFERSHAAMAGRGVLKPRGRLPKFLPSGCHDGPGQPALPLQREGP